MDILHVTLGFLLAAAVVSVIAEGLRLPYTIALVLAGLAAGNFHLIPSIRITPEGLVTLLVLPLLFEGGLHLSAAHLKTYGWLVGGLAVAATLVAVAVIGGAAALTWHLPLRSAFLLGAIASAIDPVGVIALVREARLDTRLGTILEGEAVFNDAVAFVLFTLASAPSTPGVAAAAGQFVWLLGMGTLVGIAFAVGIGVALSRIRQHLVETLGSLILAISAFIAADGIHASGVIAVVVAGVVFGNAGPHTLTEAGRRTTATLWEVIVFLANSALFLLIGLAVPWKPLYDLAGLIAIVAAAALVARAGSVYALSALFGRIGAAIPVPWRHVLVWGGLRGGMAVALVLSLAPDLPGRHEIASGVYGLVLFTLLVQGLSIGILLRRVGLLREPASG
ncbi:MAG TPA: cation:proton antiporter [bacterium]|nr:cation:proton antiporter [bacterium]